MFLKFALIQMLCLLSEFVYIKTVIPDFTRDALLDKSITDLFAKYKEVFHKTYDINSPEGLMRLEQLEKSFRLILSIPPGAPYVAALNQFSDLTLKEMNAMRGSVATTPDALTIKFHNNTKKNKGFLSGESFFLDLSENQIFPDVIQNTNQAQNTTFKTSNWTHLFLPARDQGPCGCCWSYSTASLIESRAAKNYNITPFYLSTQKSLSCDTTNNGCDGGWYGNSLPYIQSIGGLPLDSDYPFTGSQTPCSNSSAPSRYSVFTNISYCTNIEPNMLCNDSIIAGFLESGPVAVSVDGSQLMMAYSSGIFTGACTTMNHAVVLVGFGFDIVTGLNFFIVRNTWGATWGENGYIRIARNETNNLSCFVTHSAFIVNY